MRRRLAPVALSLLALALPATAVAAPEQEPNDGIHQAQGPVVGSTTYEGAISVENDIDWYIVYVSGQGLLDVATTNTPDDGHCYVATELRDQDGEYLNAVATFENQTESISYNTPGAGVYYITVFEDGCPPNDYALEVTGPVGSGSGPGVAQPTPNAHHGVATAFGPLSGATLYGGSIDTVVEEDWFFFYTSGGGAFDVAVMNIGDGNSCSVSTEMFNRGGDRLILISTAPDRVGHIRLRPTKAAKFVLRFFDGGCPVNRYQFYIVPGGLLTATDAGGVAGPSQACKTARAKRKTAKRRLKAAKAKVGSATTRKARRKARGVVKKRKRNVKRANARVKSKCP